MTRFRIARASAIATAPLLLFVACSGGSSDGNKSAFCKTNGEISAEVNAAPSLEKLADAFKKVEGKFDQYVKDAPKEVKADAQALVDEARKTIQSGDGSAFGSNAALQQAGQHVDSFCSQSGGSGGSGSDSTGASGSDSTDAAGSTTTGVPAPITPTVNITAADGWTLQPDAVEGITTITHPDGTEIQIITQLSDPPDPQAHLDELTTQTGISNPGEVKNVTVGGEDGVSREADLDVKGSKSHLSFTVTQGGPRRHTVVYSAPTPELFAAHAEEVQAMLDSILFVK